MTINEAGKFFSEKAKAYGVVNDISDEIQTKKLFKIPEAYEGKMIAFIATQSGIKFSETSKTLIPVFTSHKTMYGTFNAYGLNHQTSKAFKFGEEFVLIGMWKNLRDGLGMDVYEICGILTDKKARKIEVLCEALK